MDSNLTDRQRREVEYHREYAATQASITRERVPYEIIAGGRWWNQGWEMVAALNRGGIEGRRVLVVGCGFGTDSLLLAKMGADVFGFDISPESLEIAQKKASTEGAKIDFRILPAERLDYPDQYFDVILAHDILHHVDIPAAMNELRRVAKPGARLVVNEVYTHSIPERIRRSWVVDRLFYPLVRRVIYGKKRPYITADERKLTELDIRRITAQVTVIRRSYFNLFVMRIFPDNWRLLSKADQIALRILGPAAALVAGRILLECIFW